MLTSFFRTWATYWANRLSSNPEATRVNQALDALLLKALEGDGKKVVKKISFSQTDSFIIFSDQHKGAKDDADDFKKSEANYAAALTYYAQQGFHFINLGDSEELWENSLSVVKNKNSLSIEVERKFLSQGGFTKVFGNHDLYWDNDPFAAGELEKMFGEKVPIWEAALLETEINNAPFRIFLTHGHQGDAQSDGNWFSKWFVANVWPKIQRYLKLNPNTPSTNDQAKTVHNKIMYEWSSRQKDLMLVTGHTHQPVFESMTHLERLYFLLSKAEESGDKAKIAELEQKIKHRKLKGEKRAAFVPLVPTYYNTGCCCFSDGGITGIEITEGQLRLVKWEKDKFGTPQRFLLESRDLGLKKEPFNKPSL